MFLNATNCNCSMNPMASMTPMGGSGMTGGMPTTMLAMQQQLLSLMMGMLSSLIQGSGGAMSGGGLLPSLPNFGGGSGSGLGGLHNFLGAGGGAPTLGGSGGLKSPGNFTQPGGKTSFNVASFNLLGSSHTAAGGNKPGMASGVSRMRRAVATMKKHNIDIAGLQEFQGDQQKAFKRLAPNFGVVGEKDNAIVYNKKKFRLVERRSVSIPYFEGHMKKMPIARLQDKKTGKQVWVVNIHNPADTKAHPRNAHNRARAIQIEQNVLRKLQATGIPVMITGDFNDRNTVDRSMGQAGMNSAAPRKAPSAIDYIFGSRGIDFSNYVFDRRPQSSGTSDHPIVVSTATL
jgi:endonuclease/exonuclease/phosphatase family metal-dependent hydrolase